LQLPCLFVHKAMLSCQKSRFKSICLEAALKAFKFLMLNKILAKVLNDQICWSLEALITVSVLYL